MPMPHQGRTIVLDNGGHTVKAGFIEDRYPQILFNCAVRPKREKRLFIGDQLDQIIDYSNLFYRRPISKGYVVNWELEAQIWQRTFQKILNADTTKCSLMVTEPPFNPKSIQRTMDEIVFEQFQFQSFYRAPSAAMSLEGWRRQTYGVMASSPTEASLRTGIVVDCGFSFTHVTPVFDGEPINYAVKRMDVGGKLLTNYLKEIVSYRAWNMMDETYLLEDVKQKLCFVSTDFDNDLVLAKNKDIKILREYVLPETNNHLGRVKGPEQDDFGGEDPLALRLSNERFTVPEVIFNPSDIGIDSAGLAEAVVRAVEACPPEIHPLLYQNVVLVGGSTQFPGFRSRLNTEIRAMIPAEFPLQVSSTPKPITAPWQGAAAMGREKFMRHAVTKAQWEEYGPGIAHRKFNLS